MRVVVNSGREKAIGYRIWIRYETSLDRDKQ